MQAEERTRNMGERREEATTMCSGFQRLGANSAGRERKGRERMGRGDEDKVQRVSTLGRKVPGQGEERNKKKGERRR